MEANPGISNTTAAAATTGALALANASGWEARLRDGLGHCCEARVEALAQEGMRLRCSEAVARRLLAARTGKEALVNAQFDLPLGQAARRVSVGLRLDGARCRPDGSWELTSEFLAMRPRARRLFAAYFAVAAPGSGVEVGNQQAA